MTCLGWMACPVLFLFFLFYKKRKSLSVKDKNYVLQKAFLVRKGAKENCETLQIYRNMFTQVSFSSQSEFLLTGVSCICFFLASL